MVQQGKVRVVTHASVEGMIFVIRAQKVMIDRDLAELYEVETKHLNRQVKRNCDRFPDEFMFPLTKKEKNELVTNCHRFNALKYSTSLPYAFTEHGVSMLASVLRSERAVKISIYIVKTFIRLREFISAHKELTDRMKELEGKVGRHDEDINVIIDIIKKLMQEPKRVKKALGFMSNKKKRCMVIKAHGHFSFLCLDT